MTDWDDANEVDCPTTPPEPIFSTVPAPADPHEPTARARFAAVEARRHALKLWATISANIAEEQARHGKRQ